MVNVLIYRFLETYFRHRWLYILPIVIMVIAAGVYITYSEPKYVAKGSVNVQRESFLSALNSVSPSDSSWWTTPAQATISEINELLRTDAFIRAIIFQTDLEDQMDKGASVVGEMIIEVRKNIWILALGDNQVQIGANHSDPVIAYQLSNAVLNSFIQWQVNAQRSESQAALDFFGDLIVEYETVLNESRQNLINYLVENPPPLRGNRSEIEGLEIQRLQGEVAFAESRYASALEKEESARLALAQIESDTRQAYNLVDAPTIPEKPEVSRRELAVQIGIFLVVGVLLSVVAITGSMLLDRTFRFPIDIYYGVHLPVLAIIPDITVRQNVFQRLRKRLLPKRKAKPVIEEIEGISENDTTSSEKTEKSKPSWFRRTPNGAAESSPDETEAEYVKPGFADARFSEEEPTLFVDEEGNTGMYNQILDLDSLEEESLADVEEPGIQDMGDQQRQMNDTSAPYQEADLSADESPNGAASDDDLNDAEPVKKTDATL